MATVSTLVDDLDGKSKAAETVTFSLDGEAYEIDLTSKHAQRMRADLALFTEHARRARPARPAPGRGAARRSHPAPFHPAPREQGASVDTRKVREWARENGHDIKDRGRVPADLIALYKAAQPA